MSYPVSVVIPCRGMSDTVARAEKSARNAGAQDVQVVYDEATWAAGVCWARNMGIEQAKHDLIIPLDADDILSQDGIAALYNAWTPGVWVYGDWLEGQTPTKAPPPGMLTRKNVCHATMLFHRDDWRRVGGYDVDFSLGGEDYAFQLALTAAGVQPVHVDAVVYGRAGVNARTHKARAWAHVINALARDKYKTVMG